MPNDLGGAAAAPDLAPVAAPETVGRRLRRMDARSATIPFPASATPREVRPAKAKRVHVVEHPIAQHALTVLRNKHTLPEPFRRASHQLLAILAAEATRTLPLREEAIETPAADHVGRLIARPVVFLSLTRHGIGLAHDIAAVVPDISIGAISLERPHRDQPLEPRLSLVGAPPLDAVRVLLFEPVVSGGLSATLALKHLRGSGATDLALLSFVASAPGLDAVLADVPDLTVWTAAVDPEWDPKRGTLPGLGDFARRLYG